MKVVRMYLKFIYILIANLMMSLNFYPEYYLISYMIIEFCITMVGLPIISSPLIFQFTLYKLYKKRYGKSWFRPSIKKETKKEFKRRRLYEKIKIPLFIGLILFTGYERVKRRGYSKEQISYLIESYFVINAVLYFVMISCITISLAVISATWLKKNGYT